MTKKQIPEVFKISSVDVLYLFLVGVSGGIAIGILSSLIHYLFSIFLMCFLYFVSLLIKSKTHRYNWVKKK